MLMVLPSTNTNQGPAAILTINDGASSSSMPGNTVAASAPTPRCLSTNIEGVARAG
jgi:hypothetical protein